MLPQENLGNNDVVRLLLVASETLSYAQVTSHSFFADTATRDIISCNETLQGALLVLLKLQLVLSTLSKGFLRKPRKPLWIRHCLAALDPALYCCQASTMNTGWVVMSHVNSGSIHLTLNGDGHLERLAAGTVKSLN